MSRCCPTSSGCSGRSVSHGRETSISVTAIILAAGKGTRMRSARPKVLHTLAGWPMIAHVLVATDRIGANRTLVVLGHEADLVRRALPPGTGSVVQEPQRGTGHAVQVALAALAALPGSGTPLPGAGLSRHNTSVAGNGAASDEATQARQSEDMDVALILYGDMPLIRPETLRALLRAHGAEGHPLSLLSALVPEPHGYGRVLRDAQGHVTAVKEQKELALDEEDIAEINCGVYCADLPWLRRAVADLPEHGDGEYYLPDLVPMALAAGGVSVVRAATPDEAQGINTRVQLAAADRLLRLRINEAHMLAGVTIVDPTTTYVEPGVRIGRDSTIYPNTHLRGATVIGEDCEIGPDSDVVDSTIDAGARVVRSVAEGATVRRGCAVGPFAHLRHGAVLEEGTEIGNYAEVKNSTIGPGSVSHHFSYIGDTTVGARVNVGAGAVTANYDGARKHRTVIGDDVFVGVGTLLRAPVTLGAGAATGAGAVVLHDVPPGATVAGVPAREIVRKGGDERR